MHFQSTTILAFFTAAATLVAAAPPRTKDFIPNCGTATMTNTCVRDEGVYCTIDGSGHPYLYAPAYAHNDCLSVGTGGKCSCVGNPPPKYNPPPPYSSKSGSKGHKRSAEMNQDEDEYENIA